MEIREIKNEDIKKIAKFMERSFEDSILYTYIIPEEEKRGDFIRDFFAYRLKYAMKDGKVFITTDKKAVSAWLPSDSKMSPLDLMRYGGIKPMAKIGKEGRQKLIESFKVSDELKDEIAPMYHWSLSPIAVHRDYWGKGYASKLMEHTLNHLDREGIHSFLLTQSKTNLGIYEKFDYKLLKERAVEGSDFKHYAMLRKPQ